MKSHCQEWLWDQGFHFSQIPRTPGWICPPVILQLLLRIQNQWHWRRGQMQGFKADRLGLLPQRHHLPSTAPQVSDFASLSSVFSSQSGASGMKWDVLQTGLASARHRTCADCGYISGIWPSSSLGNTIPCHYPVMSRAGVHSSHWPSGRAWKPVVHDPALYRDVPSPCPAWLELRLQC
jgi:hypothetical protein